MTATVVAICVAGVLASAQAPARRAPSTTPASTAAAAASGTALNLNTATAAQLEALPGIGKAVADRIIEYRQKSGSFKRVEDLMNVRGIGEKSFLRLKPLVTVGTAKQDREP
jgi:competence protein ComEA